MAKTLLSTPAIFRSWTVSDVAMGFLLAVFFYFIVPGVSHADESTAVPLKGLFDFLAPYILALIGALIAAGLTFVTNMVSKATGISIEAKHREALHSAVMTAAGKIWAMADSRIATMSIDPGVPFVKQGVEWITSVGAPDAAKKFGLTPDDLASLLVSKLGIMQATAAAAAPRPAPIVPNPDIVGTPIVGVPVEP